MNRFLILILLPVFVFSQKKPEDFGYKHLVFEYKKLNIDVIIKSKKGEENLSKPILFFCQGSLSQPVIKYNETTLYKTFPFDENDFLTEFHLVIVGKPGIPVISETKLLKRNYEYLNSNDSLPLIYSNNNNLNYYVDRNDFIIKKLWKEKWVSRNKLIIVGHSEGSSIAAKLARKNNKITHLIYSSGNPYGRISSILQEDILKNKNYSTIEYWKEVVANKNNNEYNGGDTFKSTFDFSLPTSKNLVKLKIPVLISYGTKDWSSTYNDYFYIETIRLNLNNFTFTPYFGLEHNYFPVNDKSEINYEIYNWESVGKDWLKWLKQN